MGQDVLKASVQWADRARRDFRDILFYLKNRSPQAAMSLVGAISRQIQRLKSFPEAGRRVPEFPDSQPALRELIIADYRLVYVFRSRKVEILTIFHGRREFIQGFE